MSLLNSLFSGVSGLRNHQSMMDVIGNNIANVNTIGYKGSRVTFSDTFNQFVKAGTNPTSTSGGTNSFQVGLGSKLNSIDRNWAQGTFERTGVVTDLALQGPGLFVLKSNGSTYFSRAGNFTFDANGNLINPQNGAIVQGKIANGLGEIPSGTTLQDIKIDTNLRLPAIKTTESSWVGNLTSSSPTLKTDLVQEIGNLNTSGSNPISEADASAKSIFDADGNEYQLKTWYDFTAGDPAATPPTTDSWAMNYRVYDAEGNPLATDITDTIPLTFDPATGKCTNGKINITDGANLNFELDPTSLNSSANSTTVSSKIDRGEVNTPVTGAVTVFDSLGNSYTLTIKYTHLDTGKWKWEASLPNGSGTITNTNSGSIMFGQDGTIQSISQGGVTTDKPMISFNPSSGAETQDITLDFGGGTTGITQTNLSGQVSALSQNGSASASLTNLNVDQYGKIVGIFSNGVTRTLAQVMVATFNNQNGLVSVGDGMYTVAANSGDPRFSEPGENSATTIQSGALEQSNVDLSEEFTRMIVSQRGFQANARVITTSDSLLQEITNLVR